MPINYYFSADKLSDTENDSINLAEYQSIAKKLYWDSLALGSIRSASILGEIAVIEEKPSEAMLGIKSHKR